MAQARLTDVLLTHTNHVYSDPKQVAKMQAYPPLQTILVAATLEQHGIHAALFDPALAQAPQESFIAALKRHRPGVVMVCEDDFNFLSKMCLARNRELAFWMARTAKHYGIEAVVHGSDASDHAGAYLAAGFSAVALGEPEATLLELARGCPRSSIAGLAYACGEGLHYNAPRRMQSNLDELPLPAWRLVDIEQYRRAWIAAHGYFSLNLASSRGCPYRCNWCAKPIYGNSYHAHSPQRVAAEMLEIKQRFQPDHVWFADDIFALSPRWTNEFAAAVESCQARTPFKMQSRCDLMTRDTVKALRQAGCEEVWMGAESGSQRVLDAMDKDIRIEEIYAARENLRAHGIRACFFLQFGYPGETWDDIQATVRMVRETAPDDVGVSVSYPLPGTKFHHIVATQIGAKANWRDSADLSMIFRGEFSTAFYRALAEAVHAEVRGGAGSQAAWRTVHQLRPAMDVALAAALAPV
jgi:anaerobic magnesium-protoporphyrin IX monomethyl ester cyclase